ncbi:MAG: rnhA [Dehalococcoidia bacterium]|nr:rnhA [Dehalococcoidia bacterium]
MPEMIHIYTDGSCQGNPGPGGWGAIVERDGKKRELAGREGDTTNNRMEITAAIRGLEATPDGSEVTIHSDSQYLVNTMTRGWKRNANQDLWAALDTMVKHRRVRWQWVRGHVGHPENERADSLARGR